MAEFVIDEFFDIPKLEKELETVISLVSKRLKNLQSFRVNLDGSRTAKEYADAVKLISAEQAQLLKQTEQLKQKNLELSAARKQMALELQRESSETRKLNAERRQAIKEKENERKIAQQAANEYFNLNKALADAELRYKNLALTQGFSNKQTQIALKEALAIRNVLDKVDQNLRNYQRNVGNYSSAFNGLGNSLQQILREAPSLAVSANTFFLAISNNLPILFDEITKIKTANKEAAAASQQAALVAKEQAIANALAAGAAEKAAKAEGELAAKTVLANAAQSKTPSLLELIGRNLFSVQSALTIGITLFTLYGAKIGNFVLELFKGKPVIDQFAEQQKRMTAALTDSKDEFVRATQEVSNLKIAIDQAKRGIITKEEAVKLYNDTIGKTTGYVKNLEEAERSIVEKGDAYIRFTLLKAAANAALSKSAEAIFEAELNTRKKISDLEEQAKNSPVVNADSIGGYDQFLIKIGEKDKAARRLRLKEAKNDESNYFKEIAAQFTKEAEELAKRYKFDFNAIKEPKGTKDKKGKDASQNIDDNTPEILLREAFERQKILLERSKKNNREIFEDEKEVYQFRLFALKRFSQDQIALIDLEKEYAIAAEKLRLKGVIDSLEQQKKEKGANIKAINEQEAKEILASKSIIQTIEERAKDKLLDVGDELNKGLQKLADERQKIRDKEAKDAEERYRVSKGAFDKEKELINQSIEEINEKIKAGKLQLYDELRNALFQFFADSITREEQYLDEQQRLVDETLRRRTNQINQLGLSESERVRQTAIAEKNAMAQTEQIEKRKRQLAVERARFEKLANIASIISTTAQAVVGALKPDGYTPLPLRIQLAAVIGAIGAVQLAKAISTPLPRYKGGRGKGKDELAITGDGGVPEYIIRQEGHIEQTPAKPTLTHLKAGDMVMKDGRELVRHMIEAANPWHQIQGKWARDKNIESEQLLTERTGKKIITAIRDSKPEIKMVNNLPIESQAWWIKAFKG